MEMYKNMMGSHLSMTSNHRSTVILSAMVPCVRLRWLSFSFFDTYTPRFLYNYKLMKIEL